MVEYDSSDNAISPSHHFDTKPSCKKSYKEVVKDGVDGVAVNLHLILLQFDFIQMG